MVNPGEMHDGSSLDRKPRGWKMLFFEPKVVCEILANEERHRIVTLRPTVRGPDQSLRFGRLFDAVTDPQPDGLHIEECLVRTFAHAFWHHGSQRPLCFSTPPGVDKVVKLIDREPEKPLSLQAMSDAGVSRFHFLRGFARVTGATPHAYIVQRRVRLARRLLAAGQEVGQASAEAGFSDQSHMTRTIICVADTTSGGQKPATRSTRCDLFLRSNTVGNDIRTRDIPSYAGRLKQKFEVWDAAVLAFDLAEKFAKGSTTQ
jgi:AraC-like DNA-binding protein